MKIEDAWLAGIIEGEGCIDRKKRPGQRDAIRIRVKMTDEDIVNRVSQIFGTKYHLRPQPVGRKPQYETIVTGRHANEILDRIFPILGNRRQAKIEEVRTGLLL